MASEYKKRGGGYDTDKKDQDESQKHLSKWTEEEWQTKEGSGTAKQDDGTRKRYLPKKAWEKMSEEEKQQTEDKKEEGSKEGKQFVENTEKAKDSGKKANREEDEDFEDRKAKEREQGAEVDDKDEAKDEDEAEYEDDGEADVDDEDGEAEEGDAPEQHEDEVADEQKGEEAAKPGQKRKAGKLDQSNDPTKKQKANDRSGNAPKGKVGSKHMDAKEPAPRGSADRLPKESQKITWKAMPGYVDGKVVEILTAARKINGKNVKASEKDPRVVMKSESSGKICVHKPEACFYD
ncbi:hypothetical protein LTR97_004246 [Elasticomyces elasticus]|uniref:Hypervirulence associated protein TUDOR domain-containing protein n=1 Tax=Elasticomyces elasticus TaxID=574655 RepID=A0AAN7VTZ7_9PEZI|nr:hypothetical protein LTR97_004246 [Elasticomyces elasticus]